MPDDDISIDLSKIFGFLKKGNKPKGKTKQKPKAVNKKESTEKISDEDFTFNIKEVFKLGKKYSVVLLILIPILLSFYIRTVPNRLPITEDFARSSIYNQIQNNIAEEISKQYPYLPASNKNALISENFNKVLAEQKQAIDQTVKQNSDYIKSHFKDTKGYTYLGDIDSYYWLRYAANILNHGDMGDEVRDGKLYDNHMVAPIGFEITTPNIYPYIEAYLFLILGFFNSGITLMQTAFYTPLVIAIIAVIAAFFIGRKIAGNLGGFFAGTLTAVHPTIISRSLGSDNDIVNIMFPLLILWVFMLAFDSKSRLNKIIFSTAAGLLLGLYSFAWSGYWHIFYFLLGTLGFYLAYLVISDFKAIKKSPLSFIKEQKYQDLIIIGVLFIISSGIGIALFTGMNEVISLPNKPIRISELKVASRSKSIWPNVYTTVAELNEASLAQIVSGVGGTLFFILALMGIILTLVDMENELMLSLGYIIFSLVFFAILINAQETIRLMPFLMLMSIPILAGIIMSVIKKYNIEAQYAILIYMWFAATIYASTKGIRFILLIVPAFVVALSLFVGKASKILLDFVHRNLSISKSFSKVIVFIILCSILIQPVKSGYQTAKTYMPHVNDAWVFSLEKIKSESNQNAIVNSWWDFGHWFKYFTDRAVTFDGASQNQPQAHWIGKVLLTDDEEQAVNILRMLDCGANKAYEILAKENVDNLESINLIYKIISLDKETAKKELLKHVSGEKADEIIRYTHCIPPEDYFITSEDMVGKSGVWAHFGIWNFERARIYDYFRNKNHDNFSKSLESEFGYTKDEAEKTYFELQSKTSDRAINDWIAAWPSYGGVAGCSQNKESLSCNIGIGNNQMIPLKINLTTMDAYIESGENIVHPNGFGYIEDGEYHVRGYSTNSIGYSFALVNKSNSYQVIIMAPELVGSMFTRLFYFDGEGLSHFDLFSDMTDISGQRIIVWKVDWEGK